MHINGWLDVGGIEEVLLITAKFNLREKYDLAFVSYRGNDGYAGLELQKLGYPVYGLNLTSAMYDIRVITCLVKLFKEYKPQIVHFYQKSSFIGRIAAKIAGIPVILCNEMDLNYNHVGMIAVFTKYLRKMPNVITDKVIVCSNAVRNYWDGKNSPKYMVIHVPFDSSKTLPETLYFAGKQKKGFFKNEKGPVIGTISRIAPEKGHEYLIQAMPEIIDAFPTTRLKIVGTGPLMEDMKALAKDLGLERVIQFTGFVEDLNSEFSTMDVFVLPSLTEGFPLSLQEAMAAKIPVAASAVGGIPELIDHGITGLLFSPKDSDEIAHSMIELLSDFEKAKQMGERGWEKVTTTFSPQIYIDKYDRLYNDLIESKSIVYST